MLAAAILGAAGISAVAQTSAANSAANAQVAGAGRAVDALEQYSGDAIGALRGGRRNASLNIRGGRRNALAATNDAFAMQENLLNPLIQSGADANAAYNYNLGIGDQPDNYAGFQGSPAYDFQLQQGQRAIDGSAASQGNLFSGATLRAQQEFGTGLANQSFNTHMQQLNGQASSGRAATGALAGYAGNNGSQLANIYQGSANALANLHNGFGQSSAQVVSNLGQGIANAHTGAANATAAGSIATGNAISNGLNNAVGGYMYGQQAGLF